MRVEDCLAEDFDALCRELAAQVAAIYSPDLVVGIHRGGAQVAEAMLAVDVIDARLCFVTARRPASPAKSRARLDVVLGRLPRWINDGLRVAEHTVRTRRRGWRSRGRAVEISAEASAALALARRVLVVDDAVDSGATMREVTAAIRRITPAEIRTAAIVLTLPDAEVRPDFCVRQNVLLRFPWSLDAGRAS